MVGAAVMGSGDSGSTLTRLDDERRFSLRVGVVVDVEIGGSDRVDVCSIVTWSCLPWTVVALNFGPHVTVGMIFLKLVTASHLLL
jgi:hypothetical protein